MYQEGCFPGIFFSSLHFFFFLVLQDAGGSCIITNSTFCSHYFKCFTCLKLKFNFEIIIKSYAAVQNDAEKLLHPEHSFPHWQYFAKLYWSIKNNTLALIQIIKHYPFQEDPSLLYNHIHQIPPLLSEDPDKHYFVIHFLNFILSKVLYK